jgi:hypothetical protein
MHSAATDYNCDESETEYLNLQKTIHSLGDAFEETDILENMALLRDISRPASILPVLKEIMLDEAQLSRISSRSYRHVNHFDKIVLVEAGVPNGYRLTFHMWDPPYSERELQDELIHDHRFSFWSAVLTGTLTSQEFTECESGLEFRNYQYTPENNSLENFYAFCGKKRLRPSNRVAENAGGVYFLHYTSTHRVIIPRDSMTCTLVLRSPRARNFSNVYNTTYPTTDATVGNQMFSADEMFSRLSRLYSAIEKQQRIGCRPELSLVAR